jgi:hypothetical protein
MKSLFNLNTLVVILVSLFILACAASKVKVSPYVGDWHYIAQTQDGEMAVVMTIIEIENGYSGILSTDMGSGDMEDLKIEDGKLTASFDFEGYQLSMKGQFDEGTYTGTTSYEDNEWPMNATREQEAVQ